VTKEPQHVQFNVFVSIR